MYTNRPVLSIVLSIIAGVFVVVDGAVLWNEGWFLNLIHPGIGNFSLFYGQTEALEGFLIIALAFVMMVWPRTHLYAGLAIVIISVVSLPGGGGFFLGWVIGAVGGILGMVFRLQYYYPGPEEFRVARKLSWVVYGRPPVVQKSVESSPSEPVSNLRDSTQ